ncbi:non-classical arabinogalactan protein 30-like [Diospyros lotus]|uniref:non-classical arabinogalactan protein 30-like n=1 Tax=Diospyros lotus TaxID=55363 RepID=UPI00224F9C8A|nr:non-classical arabinogalactan protein 30-like [Diospyros lotus]
MAIVAVKAVVLLLSCFTLSVSADLFDLVSWSRSTESKDHHNAPAYPPAEAPKHPKAHPPQHQHHPRRGHLPVHPPVHPPSSPLPKRNFVAVQGVVYCKPCKYAGVETLLGATPLAEATVRLECNNTKFHPLVQEAKTDKNGYFFIMAAKGVTNYGAHKCKVALVSSPSAACSKPTDLHSGKQGAVLIPKKPPVKDVPKPLPFELFSVGPFAFEPPTKCH